MPVLGAGIGAPHSSQCSSAASRSTVERCARRISPLAAPGMRSRSAGGRRARSRPRLRCARRPARPARSPPRRRSCSVSAEDGQPLHAPSSRSAHDALVDTRAARRRRRARPGTAAPRPARRAPARAPAPDAARAAAAGARRARPRPARRSAATIRDRPSPYMSSSACTSSVAMSRCSGGNVSTRSSSASTSVDHPCSPNIGECTCLIVLPLPRYMCTPHGRHGSKRADRAHDVDAAEVVGVGLLEDRHAVARVLVRARACRRSRSASRSTASAGTGGSWRSCRRG